MNSYWAIIKDGWYWAKDRKFVIFLPLLFALLLIIFIVCVKLIPDPDGLKRQYKFTNLLVDGHYCTGKYERTFDSIGSTVDYVQMLLWENIPRHGFQSTKTSSGAIDGYEVI
ncbi:MAG: hypothetical protein HY606_03070, partial [Planctomycetes bacterium]|nr:hypothetical protein [Planctomycetota bacterium]